MIARNQGWKPPYDVAFGKLPPHIQRSNEAAARRIPDVLALVGLRLIPTTVRARQAGIVREHLERHIEILAEAEHNGWMAHLFSEGWKFAESRADDQRLHDCLVPFHELREIDKEKDRNSVRSFPDFVRRAGFKIAFI